MANLQALPVELLLQISQYLCPHCTGEYPKIGQNTHLSCLTRTCRRLRDVLQPYLFHHYYYTSDSATRLLSFLRALSTRPALSKYITSLGFHEACRYTSLSENDRIMTEDCVTRLGLPTLPQNWHDHAVENNRNQIPMKILIASCPNLETLDIHVNPEWMLDVLNSLPRATTPIVFNKLRTLRIYYSSTSRGHWAVKYEQIESLLHAAPNLEQLTLPNLNSFYEGIHELPRLEKLIVLRLENSTATPYFFKSILSACPRLEKFRLHCIGADRSDENSRDLSTMDVWKALQHTRQSLCDLVFLSNYKEPEERVVADCLSTLSGFAKLKKLVVSGVVLEVIYQAWVRDHGHDMEGFFLQLFPAPIRMITLFHLSESLLEAVPVLVQEDACQQYPRLGRILIIPRENKPMSFPSTQQMGNCAIYWRNFDQTEVDIYHMEIRINGR